VGEVVETVAALDQAMADLRFDAAANAIYHFVWDTFCDWYIELIKGSFDDETRAVAGWVLDQILVMLHPFMPFVTEELWHALGARDNELIVARWPAPQAGVDAAAKAEVEWLIALVSALRTAKNELGIAPGARWRPIWPSRARRPPRPSPPTRPRSSAWRVFRRSTSPRAGRGGDADRGGRCHAGRAARRRDRHCRRKGPPGKALAAAQKEAKALKAASATLRSSNAPSPKRWKRPAPTTRTTAPKPNAAPRWRGWGKAGPRGFASLSTPLKGGLQLLSLFRGGGRGVVRHHERRPCL
jgi:valyl-tRNA synthetase